jgi:type VI secretion system protein ImpK
VVAPPPPPPADEPTFLDRLRAALKPEIDQGLVVVGGTPSTPMVRIRNRNMFPSGTAKLQPAFIPLLEHVGTALGREPGRVTVAGYTDNQPIRTVQFPSNFQLSAARANAAKEVLARTLADPGRAIAEGRADADPLAPNTTADGREQNRRIEITLRREN